MAENVLVCSGPITVDVNGVPACLDGWLISDINTYGMTNAEFSEMWPMILGMFIAAIGVRYVRRVFVPY